MKDNKDDLFEEVERDLYDEIFNSGDISLKEALENEFGGEDEFLLEFGDDDPLLDIILDGEEYETPYERELAKKELIKTKRKQQRINEYREQERLRQIESNKLNKGGYENHSDYKNPSVGEYIISSDEISSSNSGSTYEYFANEVSRNEEVKTESMSNTQRYRANEDIHRTVFIKNDNKIDKLSISEKQEQRAESKKQYEDEHGITAFNEMKAREEEKLAERKQDAQIKGTYNSENTNFSNQQRISQDSIQAAIIAGTTKSPGAVFKDITPTVSESNSFVGEGKTFASFDGKSYEQKRQDDNLNISKTNINSLYSKVEGSSKANDEAIKLNLMSERERSEYRRSIKDERLSDTAKNIAQRSEAIRAVDENRKLYSKYDNIKDVRDSIGGNIVDAGSKTGRIVKGRMEDAYSESLGANMERRHLPLIAAAKSAVILASTSNIPLQSIANKFVDVDKALNAPTSRTGVADFKTIRMREMGLEGISYKKLPELKRQLNKQRNTALKGGKVKLAEKLSNQMADIDSVLKVTGTGRKGNKLSKKLNKRTQAWKALRTAPYAVARQTMMAGGDPFATGITILGDIKAYGKQGYRITRKVTNISNSGVKLVGRVTGVDKQLVKVGGKLSNKLFGDSEFRYLKYFTRESKYDRRYARMAKSPVRKVSRTVSKTAKKTTKKVVRKTARKLSTKTSLTAKLAKGGGKAAKFVAMKVKAAVMAVKSLLTSLAAAIGTALSSVLIAAAVALAVILLGSIILSPNETDVSRIAEYLSSKQVSFVESVNKIKELETDDTTVVFETDLTNMLDNRREILSMATVYFNNDFTMDWFQESGITDTNYKHYVNYLFDVSHQVSQTSKFETRKRTEERASMSYSKMYAMLNSNNGMDEINEFYLDNGFIRLSNGQFRVRDDVQFEITHDGTNFKLIFEYDKIWTEKEIVEIEIEEEVRIENSYCDSITWYEEECWETIIRIEKEERDVEKTETVIKDFNVSFTPEEQKKLRYELENDQKIILSSDGTKFSFVNTVPYEHHVISVNVDVKRFPEIFAADGVGTVHGSTPKLKLATDIVLSNLLKEGKYDYVGKKKLPHEAGIYQWRGIDLAKIIDSIYKTDENQLKVLLGNHGETGEDLLNQLAMTNSSLVWISKDATTESNNALKDIMKSTVAVNAQKDAITKLVEQKISTISTETDSDILHVFLADAMTEHRLISLDMDLRKVISGYSANEPKSPNGALIQYELVYGKDDKANREYASTLIQGRLGELDGTSDTAFIYPLDKLSPVTGEFGPRSQPDGLGGVNLTNHRGIDVRAKMGTELFSSIDGVVTGNSYSTCGGNVLEITSTNGKNKVVYKHMNASSPHKKGTQVVRGQFVGFSGGKANSGDICTTGPHLHFEIHEGGQAINPRQYIDFGKGPNGDYSGSAGGQVWNAEEYPDWIEEGGWTPENREWAYLIYTQDWNELYELSSPDKINAAVLPIIDGDIIIEDEDSDTSSVFDLLIAEFEVKSPNDRIALEALKAYQTKYNKYGVDHNNPGNGLNEFGYLKYALNKAGKLNGNWNSLASGIAGMQEIFLKGDGGETVEQVQIGDIGFRNNPKIEGIANSIAIYIGDGKWISMTSSGVDIRSGTEFLHHYRP